MTISIKEYAEAMGISTAAAYKRLSSEKYSRYLVTEHGRKRLDRAILDDQPGIQPDSTLQVENSTTLSTTVSTNSTTQVESSTADSTDSTVLSTILSEDSTIRVETSTTDSTGEVERVSTNSTNSTALSTSDQADSTADAQAVILQIRLDYAQRDIERLEQQLDDMRQLVADLRGQLFAKDTQISELSERLREAHVLTQNAQKRPRLPFTGWLDRLIGRRDKAAENATEGQKGGSYNGIQRNTGE